MEGNNIMQDADRTQIASIRILGRYQLLRRVGKGGMGEVWLGEDPRLHRQIAIKTLPLHHSSDREFMQRFEREARAAAALNHPHILPVHDYGEQRLPDGQAITYIVMPYVSDGTLAERIKMLTANGTPMPPGEAIEYLSQAADAIDYAHAQHVLHRDIKPSNMLMRSGNWVLLADFGIARVLSDAENLTQAGVGIGTPEYMAPEQAQGKPEAASDNYSLAVIAYQLFTGQLPFQAETPYAMTVQHIIAPPPLPRQINPNLSPAVEQALLHGLAKEPAQRPPSARAFVEELQNALKNGSFNPALYAQTVPASGPGAEGSTLVSSTNQTLITPPLVSGGPGDGTVTVPPAPTGITRRRVLIGGTALLIVGGVGAWALASQLHSSSSTTVATPKPIPTTNPNAPILTLNAHTQPISSLAWSPTTPNILVSAGKDSQVMLWDISAISQGQASPASPKAKQQFDSSTVSPVLLAWSTDGSALAIANAVFVLEPSKKLVDMHLPIYASDLSAPVPYYNDKLMTFLRTSFISAVSWGPGKYIIAITRPNELAAALKYRLEFRDPQDANLGLQTIIEFGFGYSAVVSPDKSTLAIGIYNGIQIAQPLITKNVAQWKATPTLLTFDGTKPLTFDGNKPPVGAVTWSPDGRYVAGITNPLFAPKYLRSQLAVWDVPRGDATRLSLNLPSSDTILTTLAWSLAPTSTHLAAGDMDGAVHIWEVNPNNLQGNALPTRTLIGVKGAAVTALAWSVDGRWLAAGYNDANDSVLIWKV